MDKKLKNDLMDIGAELVVSPLTAYVKAREIYLNFKGSETNEKITKYAEQKGEEIQKVAKKISVNVNDRANKFVGTISDKAMDFSKKAEEFSQKAEKTFNEFDERKENMIYEFTGKADDALKEFSENVKTVAKDFGDTVTQKINDTKKEGLGEVVSVTKAEVNEEPVVCAEPVELTNVAEEPTSPQANTIFENKTE